MKLGGSIFVRNAIKYDYCLKEAVESLVDCCDEVVALECESEDGTRDILSDLEGRHKNLRVVDGIQWDCATNYERLAILANKAISMLDSDWHVMLQADEVLHQESFPTIRREIENAKKNIQGLMCRRINLFGNIDNYISYDLPVQRKPVSDLVIRVGRRGILSIGDAESLNAASSNNFADQINIFHYGFVRKSSIHVKKAIDMQSWFNGANSKVDTRLFDMRDGSGQYDPTKMFSWSDLKPLYLSHPKYAEKWVEERRGEYPVRPT